MKQKLSPSLQSICDLELALGNTIAQVDDPGPAAFPLAVVFTGPLHRMEIESKIKIAPPVKWWGVGKFGGYVSEDTRQSVQGPMPNVVEAARVARRKLSPNLQAIYDLEVALGNEVIDVNELPGFCSLAMIFGNPLHKRDIESTLSLSPSLKWWEEHDPHYAIQGGYRCAETGHAIAGPLG